MPDCCEDLEDIKKASNHKLSQAQKTKNFENFAWLG